MAAANLTPKRVAIACAVVLVLVAGAFTDDTPPAENAAPQSLRGVALRADETQPKGTLVLSDGRIAYHLRSEQGKSIVLFERPVRLADHDLNILADLVFCPALGTDECVSEPRVWRLEPGADGTNLLRMGAIRVLGFKEDSGRFYAMSFWAH